VPDNTIYVTGTIPSGNRGMWDVAATKPAYNIHAIPSNRSDQTQFELIDSFDQDKPKIIQMSVKMDVVRISMPGLGAPGELYIRHEPPTRIRVNGRPLDAKYDPALVGYRILYKANTAYEIEVVPFAPGTGL